MRAQAETRGRDPIVATEGTGTVTRAVAFAISGILVGASVSLGPGPVPSAAVAAVVGAVGAVWSSRSGELRRSRASTLSLVAAGSLGAWTFASALWSSVPHMSLKEGALLMLPLVTFAATWAVASSGLWLELAAGAVFAVVVCDVFSLASRLFPMTFGTYDAPATLRADSFGRLYQPIGYANGLGVISAAAILLCVGAMAFGRGWVRRLAAAALVPLSAVLYLTFSRGSVFALVVATGLVGVLLRRRSGWWVAVAIGSFAPLVGVAVIHAHGALTTIFRRVDAQAAQGRRVAIGIAVLAAAALAVPWLIDVVGRTIASRQAVRFAVLLAAIGLGVGGAVLVGHRAMRSLDQSRPHFAHGDLNLRFLTLSPNGRGPIWRVAYNDFTVHPMAGSGAGTYAHVWAVREPTLDPVPEAHSLYLETAAELGVVGLAALLIMLGAPFSGAWPVRRNPVVAVLVGAYTVFVIQWIADWTWALPGVSVTAMTLAGCLLAASDAPSAARVPGSVGDRSPRRLADAM
jgi:O-antigen ligase